MTREFPKNPEPQKVAYPTVGRIVYVYDAPNGRPLPAMVVEVVDGSHTIETMHVFEQDGLRVRRDVKHADDRHGHDVFWDWMPYQKGQAAKIAKLEVEKADLANMVLIYAYRAEQAAAASLRSIRCSTKK